MGGDRRPPRWVQDQLPALLSGHTCGSIPRARCEGGTRGQRPLSQLAPAQAARAFSPGPGPQATPLGPLLGSSEALAVGRGLRRREGASEAQAGLCLRPLTPRAPFGAGAGSPRSEGHPGRGLCFVPQGLSRRPPSCRDWVRVRARAMLLKCVHGARPPRTRPAHGSQRGDCASAQLLSKPPELLTGIRMKLPAPSPAAAPAARPRASCG